LGINSSPKYVCENETCELNFDNKSCWNSTGDFFSGNVPYEIIKKLFLYDQYAALNSISKQSEVEIYKHGLKKEIYLHPIFCLWILKPYIEFNYKEIRWEMLSKELLV